MTNLKPSRDMTVSDFVAYPRMPYACSGGHRWFLIIVPPVFESAKVPTFPVEMNCPFCLLKGEAFTTERSAKELLLALRIGEHGCWCEVAIGNPMMKDHTDACKETQAFFRRNPT